MYQNETLLSEQLVKASLSKDDVFPNSNDSGIIVSIPFKMNLAYLNLSKIDNSLHGYGHITCLFLNNNRIEDISGLDHLIHLRHLDLSFNRIVEIKGLHSLNLNVLSLYVSAKATQYSSCQHLPSSPFLIINADVAQSYKYYRRNRALH
jgi:hypothetical protein